MKAEPKKAKKKKNPERQPEKKQKIRIEGMDIHSVYYRSEDIVAREIEGELILIPISAGIGNMENEIYALDETGKEIWALLDGKKSLNEIIVDLEKCYSASAGTVRRDVLGLIGELARRGIVLAASSH